MSSRTKNASRNIMFGLVNKAIHLVFPFVIRSATIQVLGAEYLGLGSLFTSILQVLNLAEMGFSNAVIYNMYKPVAENDTEKICALMNLYKKIYRIIGLVVLAIGLAVMPFLGNLIEGDIPTGISLYVLYSIYLFNTVSTYFLFAYKSALLNAHQRNDIISNVNTVTSLLQFILQLVVLVVMRNYYAFVIVQCVTAILNNICVAIVAKHKYPQYVCHGEVPAEQKKDIRKRVTGLMIQKVCATTRNSLDSIFISSMIGLTTVAMYSNYYTIMTAIIGVMSIVTSSVTASVGNSVVTETIRKNYNDMNKFNFIYMWLSGWLTVCLACLYQPLMRLWMGETNMFPYEIVVLFCIYFYSLKMGDIRSVYFEAKGLWYESRYRAIAESVANVILNLVLGYFFGVAGIIAGTLISLLIINFGYGSHILFKHYFGLHKLAGYFMHHMLYAFVTLIICFVTYYLCTFIHFTGITELIVKGLICTILPNILYYLLYCKTDMFHDAKAFVKNFTKKHSEKGVSR